MEDTIESLHGASQAHCVVSSQQVWKNPTPPYLGTDLIDSIDAFADSNNAEKLYADIHKSVDQAVAIIAQQQGMALEVIQVQNHRVFTKLMVLEREVQQFTPTADQTTQSFGIPPNHTTMNIDDPLDPSQISGTQSVDLDHIFNTPTPLIVSPTPSPGVAGPVANPQPTASPYVSPSSSQLTDRSLHRGTTRARHTRRLRQIHPKRTGTANSTPSDPSPSSGSDLEVGGSRLYQKLIRIGDTEALNRLEEFTQRLKARQSSVSSGTPPTTFNFPAIHEVCNGPAFVRMLPNLAVAIEANIFGEQNSRLQKRIALSHFYHAYALGQENPLTFLSWCQDKSSSKYLLPKGGLKSVVRQRFVDLVFPETQGTSRLLSSMTEADVLKARKSKIQMWRKNGKQWAKLIKRFGYGILLMVPANLTDEDLRVAHDKEVATILDALEIRRPLFAESLQRANELLHDQLFTTPDCVAIIDESNPDNIDWDAFLQQR